MKSRIVTALALAAALTACGDKKPYTPQVDMTGHTKGQYDYDLLTCQENARQQDIAPAVVLGVTAGAALGAAGGAIAGSAASGAALGAMAGAVGGGAGASAYDDVATSNGSNRMVVRIRECMAAKGYKLTGMDAQDANDPGPPKDWKKDPVDDLAPPPPGTPVPAPGAAHE